MKKYEKLLKFIFLLLPIIVSLFVAISLEINSPSQTLTSMCNEWLYILNNQYPSFDLFDSFYEFIESLWGSNTLTDTLFHFIEYWVFVEFMFLFKNVMCYIISLANKFLEKGVE